MDRDIFISYLRRLAPEKNFAQEIRDTAVTLQQMADVFKEHAETVPQDITVAEAKEQGLITSQEVPGE